MNLITSRRRSQESVPRNGSRQVACDLRRLLRKGLLKRLPHTFRYQLTEQGSRLVLFRAKLYARIIGRGLAQLDPDQVPNRLQAARRTYEREIERLIADARLAP